MTEPIRNKFEGLDDNLQVRHNALMDKLDDLTAAIAAPVDYTAAFASLGEKLDTIATKQDTTNIVLGSVYSWLTDYALAQSERFLSAMTQLARLTTLDDNIQQIQNTLGLHNGGAEFTLASLSRAQAATLVSLWERLAGIDAPWPANVLAALECICEASSALVPPDPLDPALQPPGCVAHYQSDGQFIFPLGSLGIGTNINIATWSAAPDGLSFGNLFGLGVDQSELTFPSSEQWWAFVDSDEDQYADEPISFDRYPTREWRLLQSGPRAFSVSERGSIVVHLCKVDPFNIPEGECVNLQANTEYSGYQAWLIPAEYPDTYTFSATDNYYVLDDFGDTASGPWLANTARTFGQNRTGGGYMIRFGNATSDPQVNITVCNPSPS